MTHIETLVTAELEAQQGVWTDEQISCPVAASDIRRWAIAVYWDETPPRIYWDEGYARSTRWDGIIAPDDFNPFAWAVPMTRPIPGGALPGQEVKKGENILNGGMTDRLGVKIRPGDVIATRSRLTHWEERQGRNGLTLYTYTETEWTNQKGEIVKTRVKTTIRH
jgi:hypothetical protein